MSTIPLTVLTGFLGSGKTTLLNGLLKSPELADSAVLINEFGAVGLDHHLVESALEDAVVLDGGCVCCTVRGALSGALTKLHEQRLGGQLPLFKRVILETTGLASPAPLLHELLEHPAILAHYRLAGVIVCVDGVFGAQQIDAQPEAAQQAAVADRLLITKTDLMSAQQLEVLTAKLRGINPGAEIVLVEQGRPLGTVIADDGAYDPFSKQLDVQRWLRAESYRPVKVQRSAAFSRKMPATQDINRHGADIQAFCLSFDQPLAWDPLITALEVIAALRGPQLLRMKGILDVQGRAEPLVVHGVQHMLFPTTTLERWPPGPRRSQLVFIMKNTDADFVAHTLDFFVHARKSAITHQEI